MCVDARSTGNKSAPDFVIDRSYDGRPFRMLTVIDEYSRECLAIRAERKQSQETILETLADLVVLNGPSVISAPIIAPSLQLVFGLVLAAFALPAEAGVAGATLVQVVFYGSLVVAAAMIAGTRSLRA